VDFNPPVPLFLGHNTKPNRYVFFPKKNPKKKELTSSSIACSSVEQRPSNCYLETLEQRGEGEGLGRDGVAEWGNESTLFFFFEEAKGSDHNKWWRG